jgi:hypothetical protein
VRSQDQLTAVIKCLALAGIIEPQVIAHTGPDGGPIEFNVEMGPSELAKAYAERVRIIDVTSDS